MKGLRYKGHLARVEYDAEEHLIVGHLAGINDVIGFHGDTVAELEAAFREAVDDYIAVCAKARKTPEKAFSGKVMFRVAPDVHASAALAAQMRGVSLNQWAEDALRKQVEADGVMA